MEKNKDVFEGMTNLYSLSKTLRFELRPVGKTRTNLEKANQTYYDEQKKKDSDLQLASFLHDNQIEDAYQTLKPVFDKIHEEFITKSLESDEAKNIDFSRYFELKKELQVLKKKKSSLDKEKKKDEAKKLEDEIKKIDGDKGTLTKLEDTLRKSCNELYKIAGEDFRRKIGEKNIVVDENIENGDDAEINNDNSVAKKDKKNDFTKLLTAKNLSVYITNNIKKSDTIFTNIVSRDGKVLSIKDIEKALSDFDKFWTYFGGFDTNRKNYYETKKEASTAVATRIINENLPKFVDNIFLFEKRKEEYNEVFEVLKSANKELKIRDKEGEEKQVQQFWSDIFVVKKDDQNNVPLSQSQIDTYNEKISDNNYLINLYNQLKGQEKEFKKIPQFKTLFKQIGCGEKKEFIKLIDNDKELQEKLIEIKQAGSMYFNGKSAETEEKHTIEDFIELLLKDRENYEGIYWNKQAINTISGKYFANWHDILDKLKDAKVFQKADAKSDEKVKIPDAVQLSDLFAVLDGENLQIKDKGLVEGDPTNIIDESRRKEGVFFKSSLFSGDDKERNEKIVSEAKTPSQALLQMILEDIKDTTKRFVDNTDIIENGTVNITDFKQDTEKAKIKLWLDETLAINRMLKYFVTKENKRKGQPQDSEIENILDKLIYEFDWFKNYDAVRNYLTKKPQSAINKLKLNFENTSLAGGWDENKEKDNSCVILQDGQGMQYLAVMKYDNRILFEADDVYMSDNLGWMKMVYKLLPGPNKMLPKVLFSKKWKSVHPTPENIEVIYKNGTFKKGDDFNKDDLHSLIDFYKGELKKYPTQNTNWNTLFGFNFSNTNSYDSIDKFYAEVEKQGYKLEFKSINKQKLDALVANGKIYLFQIKNQDYNDNKTSGHKKNLHTIYWQAIFGNTGNKPKLNGEAEIFYRSAIAVDKMKKATKKDDNGNEVEVTLKNGETALQNFRYSKEKFIFHCPITLNFGMKESKINDTINKELTKPENKDNITFLGIDRGEKHLAYYSLIDQNGEIIKQGSLNIINGQNYHDKLEILSQNRDEARKNWKTIGTIKEMKNGYVSQVVHEIVKLAIDHNALIVLENLNAGFKNSRKKIEKSVYQKLELALAKKLNFVVDKGAKDGDLQSVQKALQLTPPAENFSDIEKAKQYGIMLYTRANYTSQTDPKMGWRKELYIQRGSEDKIKGQIEKFDDFGFNGKDYYFEYTSKNTGKNWKLYSGKDGKTLDRYRYNPKKKDDFGKYITEKIDIVKILDKVFEDFDKKRSFKKQIKEGIALGEYEDLKSWDSLRFAIDLIQQIRNSGPKDAQGDPTRDDDFLQSPVRDENHNHFDSRDFADEEKNGGNPICPTSGDANGAYNIARKGLMMFERIQKNVDKPDLFISDEDRDKWLQDNS